MKPSRARVLAASIFASCLAAASLSRAEPPRLEDLSSYSPYERETIDNGLQSTGRELEPDPEGKIIESVDVITLDVIEPRDPIPLRLQPIVNWFHVTTKPHFVTRELLFKVGDRYVRRIAEESARNLRALPQLSVIILIPTKGSAPDRVRMLLVTKDLWSLRVPVEYRLTSSGAFEYIQAQITEINLLGTHHQASANFQYNPDVVAFGGTFTVPRVRDSRLRWVTDANVIVNHRSGDLEGTFGSLSYYQPLYSLATEWSYGAVLGWNVGVTRRYVASNVGEFDPEATGNPCPSPKVPVEGEPEPPPAIPCKYRRDIQSGELFLTRSFGTAVKHNIEASLRASRRVFRAFDVDAFDPELTRQFVDRVLPLSDTRFGAALEYKTFEARFTRLLEVEKLGIQEEYQLGHRLILKVSPAFAPLRDSKSVIGVFAAASYGLLLGDGFLRGYIESQTDFEPQRVADGSIDVGARIVSPRTGLGRLFFDARVLHRYANYLNDFDTLGGNTRLRGYPTGSFAGKDLLAFNLEFRTRAVELLKAQIGGALFYDAGDAFNGFETLRMKQSTGVGLRIFLPQINRIVIRGDWGFPLTPGYRYGDTSAVTGRTIDGFPGELTITFGQAFPMPVVPTSEATTQ
ncbi:MAG: BamA/TamA family outer membrane protein [Polyangiaceae bacterium]